MKKHKRGASMWGFVDNTRQHYGKRELIIAVILLTIILVVTIIWGCT